MNSHYKPMFAHVAKTPFNSKDWIFEIKWDGIRAISYVNADLKIESRNDNELKYNFPELEEITQLTKKTVLDGEIVVMKNGKADFQSLLERAKSTSDRDIRYGAETLPATYVIFDILERGGKTLVGLPLIERKRILKEEVKEGKHVVLSVFVEEQGEIYYQAALKMGVEGIMAKKKDSQYRSGLRSNDWLKIKKVLSCDCVIFGYTAGQGRRSDTFGALILGLYKNGNPVYVGKVGTGFSQGDSELLTKTFQRLNVKEKTIDVADVPEKITWLRPELVCEVGYQAVTKDGRLRMPRYRILRVDKKPSECTLDQIIPTNLQEYVSKRDFSITPEPKGGAISVETKSFVVQEHHARTFHYDLRLERNGVLKSWAVPKGMPEVGTKRLAVETEDHPLEYRTFEGTIPAGVYGAGTVKIFDTGSFEPKVWEDDKMIEFILRGEKLRGTYVLTRFKRAGEKQWLLLKVKD